MAFRDAYASAAASTGTSGEVDVVDERALSALQALLPPGAAWPRDPDTELTQLLRALAYEFSRVRRRARQLIEEKHPDTTFELLEDWERIYALPEITFPTTLAGRRAALHGKMLGYSDPTPQNFEDIAAGAGYAVEIREHGPGEIFTCESSCEDALESEQWVYVWDVLYYPKFDAATDNEQDAVLVASIQLTAPAHTLPRFYLRQDWTVETSSVTTTALRGIVHVVGAGFNSGNGLWCAVGEAPSGQRAKILTSPDGVTWTSRSAANFPDDDLKAVASNGSTLLVAVGEQTQIESSPDGVAWTSRSGGVGGTLRGVTYDHTLALWCAVGDTGAIYTSSNGTAWTSRTSGTAETLHAVAASGAGLFVAVGDNGTILTSPNGTTWTARTGSVIQNPAGNLRSACCDRTSGTFFVGGDAGFLIKSTTPTTAWTLCPGAAQIDAYNGMTADTDGIVVLTSAFVTGGRGSILNSLDGAAFFDSADLTKAPRSIARSGDSTVWIAVGDAGLILKAAF